MCKCSMVVVSAWWCFTAISMGGFYYERTRAVGAELPSSRHSVAAHANHCGSSEPTRLANFPPFQSRAAVIMALYEYVTKEQLSGFDKYKVSSRLLTGSYLMYRTLACRLAVLCYHDSMRSTGVCRSREGQRQCIVTFTFSFTKETLCFVYRIHFLNRRTIMLI